MQQVFSKPQTVFVQTALSVLVLAIGLYGSYAFDLAPGFAYNTLGGIAWFLILSFVAANVAGIVLYGTNLVFYFVQVYRHGKPHENVVDSE